MRRRLILRISALTVLVLAVTWMGSPARAADTGTLKGKVINETTGQPQAGVEVTLLVGTNTQAAEEQETQTTGKDGAYEFTDLPTGADSFYALDARYDGGLFSGPPIALPDDTSSPPVVTSKLRVWDTSTDPSVISIERDGLFLVPGGGGLATIESIVITNSTDNAYIGRGGGKGDAISFGVALPADAKTENLRIEPDGTTLEIPQLIPADYGFGIPNAIPPGETKVSILYEMEGQSGTYDLSRPTLYPTDEMTFHTIDPLRLESNRLDRGDTVRIGDRNFRQWTLIEPLDAGDQMQAQAVAEAGSIAWPTVLVGAILVGGVVFSVTRLQANRLSRRGRGREPKTRQEIVQEIASLDIRYSSGELDKDEWQRRRDELKEKVGEAGDDS
jgi:hypothetical protein